MCVSSNLIMSKKPTTSIPSSPNFVESGRGKVKAVNSGDSVIVSVADRAGNLTDREINLSYISAPRLSRRDEPEQVGSIIALQLSLLSKPIRSLNLTLHLDLSFGVNEALLLGFPRVLAKKDHWKACLFFDREEARIRKRVWSGFDRRRGKCSR